MASEITLKVTQNGEWIAEDANGNQVPVPFQSLQTGGLSGADIANASADTVPTSQGDGTLAMQAPGGSDLQWTEDANSPFTYSGAGSLSGSLADTGFDEYLIVIAGTSGSGSNPADWSLTWSGATTYNYVTNGDTQTSDASSVALFNQSPNVEWGMKIYFPLVQSGSQTGANFQLGGAGAPAGAAQYAYSSGAGDITSFDVSHPNTSSIDATIEVYHRNIA